MAFRQDDGRSHLGAASMTRSQAASAEIDVGLRQHMLRVYNYMTGGLAVTGLVAYGAANTPAVLDLLYEAVPGGGYSPTMLAWIAMLAPLAFILVISFGINRLSVSAAQTLFWVFAAVMGLSMANIFLAFTDASIARVFFITAGTFGGMSLYGYTTKRDLSGMGSFLIMGLWGIIIASVVNIFMASSALHFMISIIGVLVFVGLTAYDTQAIKLSYHEGDTAVTREKSAILSALTLYLDFINLFTMLLRLFGERE